MSAQIATQASSPSRSELHIQLATAKELVVNLLDAPARPARSADHRSSRKRVELAVVLPSGGRGNSGKLNW